MHSNHPSWCGFGASERACFACACAFAFLSAHAALILLLVIEALIIQLACPLYQWRLVSPVECVRITGGHPGHAGHAGARAAADGEQGAAGAHPHVHARLNECPAVHVYVCACGHAEEFFQALMPSAFSSPLGMWRPNRLPKSSTRRTYAHARSSSCMAFIVHA